MRAGLANDSPTVGSPERLCVPSRSYHNDFAAVSLAPRSVEGLSPVIACRKPGQMVSHRNLLAIIANQLVSDQHDPLMRIMCAKCCWPNIVISGFLSQTSEGACLAIVHMMICILGNQNTHGQHGADSTWPSSRDIDAKQRHLVRAQLAPEDVSGWRHQHLPSHVKHTTAKLCKLHFELCR